MTKADDPLPDPWKYARNCTDQQLRDYRQIYGEQSREWLLAQEELARREQSRRHPWWAKWIRNLLALAILVAMIITFVL
jgi:hypothetical protein